MTHLRQAMLEELQRRNYATTTVQYYIQAVERFASTFARRRTNSIRATCGRIRRTCCASGSSAADGELPRLGAPVLLREDAEAAVHAGRPAVSKGPTPAPGDPHHGRSHPIDRWRAESDRSHDADGPVLTGMRNAALRHLQVGDIDSRRMLIHIQPGKGGRDR